jgi:hypothetical protein
MNLLRKVAALLAILTGMCWAQSPPPQAAGYTLVWSDDFTTFDLSPNSLGNYTWYNPGMWWQSPAPSANISALGSILNLIWTRGQSPANTSVATCAKDGSYCRTWRYGYFEARMRWDTVTGAWPAFWMIPKEGHSNAKEQGEWDIMEGQGQNNYQVHVHDWNNGVNNQCGYQYNPPVGVNLTDMHIYGMLWTPGQIKFYFDDALIYTCPMTLNSTIDSQNYFIILGSQEGVNWTYGNLTGVTANTIAANFNWVHVWQNTGVAPPGAPTGLTATVH